jgi:hypothetical protein
MKVPLTAIGTLALLNVVTSALMASATVWLLFASEQAAAEATREYGQNVDSGAVERVVASIYCAPAAVLFGASAVMFWRRWRFRRLVQAAALVWAVGLPLLDVFHVL